MAKNSNKTDEIIRQNKLLREQNELLREQIELLKNSSASERMSLKNSSTLQNDDEIFVDNIDCDEMRNGFLVTSQRKKLWNVEIGLINEFARICKKHNIRWFAIGGTLLGAVRHGGFIPWDDDVDIIMFRPDYAKFQEVARTEIKSPYFLDVWCNVRFEDDQINPNDKTELQFITPEEQKVFQAGWGMLDWPKMKIRDNRTCMILHPELHSVNQGIWIDIFPLDPAPPFENNQQALIFAAAKELHLAAIYPKWMKEAMAKNPQPVISRDELNNFMSKPVYVRGTLLDNFMKKHFFASPKVARTVEQFMQQKIITYTTADFEETIYLPFEKIEVPAPAGYDRVLQANYGDWRKMIKFPPHILDYSVDISSKEYFRMSLSNESTFVDKYAFLRNASAETNAADDK